jgi:hypothetical protein
MLCCISSSVYFLLHNFCIDMWVLLLSSLYKLVERLNNFIYNIYTEVTLRRLVAGVQAFSATDVCKVSFPVVGIYRVWCISPPVHRSVCGTSTPYCRSCGITPLFPQIYWLTLSGMHILCWLQSDLLHWPVFTVCIFFVIVLILLHVLVTIDSVLIGNWIYCTFIQVKLVTAPHTLL